MIGPGYLFDFLIESNKLNDESQFRDSERSLGIQRFLKDTPFLLLELKKRLYESL